MEVTRGEREQSTTQGPDLYQEATSPRPGAPSPAASATLVSGEPPAGVSARPRTRWQRHGFLRRETKRRPPPALTLKRRCALLSASPVAALPPGGGRWALPCPRRAVGPPRHRRTYFGRSTRTEDSLRWIEKESYPLSSPIYFILPSGTGDFL